MLLPKHGLWKEEEKKAPYILKDFNNLLVYFSKFTLLLLIDYIKMIIYLLSTEAKLHYIIYLANSFAHNTTYRTNHKLPDKLNFPNESRA